ncbi:MAG: hypothetical protein KZQ83_12440 [gamma proteobacterium symbiont of Taylorina sp.]|nr:hypothetical protein [gamma proteobacterium symbiont of Taylorina sp.]
MKIVILISIFLFAKIVYAGDTYIKISDTGQELPDIAVEWSCVKQNASGLIYLPLPVKPTTGNYSNELKFHSSFNTKFA